MFEKEEKNTWVMEDGNKQISKGAGHWLRTMGEMKKDFGKMTISDTTGDLANLFQLAKELNTLKGT